MGTIDPNFQVPASLQPTQHIHIYYHIKKKTLASTMHQRLRQRRPDSVLSRFLRLVSSSSSPPPFQAMANDGSGSPRARSGGGTGARRCCGNVTRVNLLIFLLTAALCSASYCLGIWYNSRGAADSRVLLGPSAAGAAYCGDDADKPLDFETHHAAEDAGLSVSVATAVAAKTTSTRRALRGAVDGSTAHRGVAWAEAGGGSLRFMDAVAVQE